jgi:hypothetical protein
VLRTAIRAVQIRRIVDKAQRTNGFFGNRGKVAGLEIETLASKC